MKKLIVAVDDQEAILQCIRNIVTTAGYNFEGVTEPTRLFELINSRENISLIILDVKMPKMDGFELYRAIRKIKKIPTLFITAHQKSFSLKVHDVIRLWQEEFADGTTDILYKPFDTTTFMEKVRGLIGSAE